MAGMAGSQVEGPMLEGHGFCNLTWCCRHVQWLLVLSRVRLEINRGSARTYIYIYICNMAVDVYMYF